MSVGSVLHTFLPVSDRAVLPAIQTSAQVVAIQRCRLGISTANDGDHPNAYSYFRAEAEGCRAEAPRTVALTPSVGEVFYGKRIRYICTRRLAAKDFNPDPLSGELNSIGPPLRGQF